MIDPEGKIAKQVVGENPECYMYLDALMKWWKVPDNYEWDVYKRQPRNCPESSACSFLREGQVRKFCSVVDEVHKVSRNGVRVGDILHNLEEVYGKAKARHEQILKSLNYE